MAAYLISDVEIRSETAFQVYRTLAAASIEAYGGKYLVRGGKVVNLEGQWSPKTIIIVEFATEQMIRDWYNSDEYAVALALRDEALTRDLIFIEGM